MRIGIDIQSTQGKPTGLGYYTKNLLSNMSGVPGFEFCYYKRPRDRDMNSIERLYWENVSLPKIIKKDRLDILHVTGFAGPYRIARPVRKVATVHDLIGMIYPANLAPISRFYWQRWLPACVKNSRLIITISEHTKRDIVRLLGVLPDKIRVTYLAANKSFRYISDSQNLQGALRKYGINSKYILSVGTIEPRKNFALLIRAFALYLARTKEEISLVIVGRHGWAYDECLKAAIELGIRKHVIFCNYVDDVDLPVIYNMAELFIFPSLYEGFGLPVLEAMQCGTPVICSNTSSLPEIAADAAMLIDPCDELKITNAIDDVLSDNVLKRSLSDKALKRSEQFSWARTAQETISVYKEAMAR